MLDNISSYIVEPDVDDETGHVIYGISCEICETLIEVEERCYLILDCRHCKQCAEGTRDAINLELGK